MTASHADSDRPPYLILGLGNVGPEYHQSRHNIGFDVIDLVAARLKLHFVPGQGAYYVSSPDDSSRSTSKSTSISTSISKRANSSPWWRRLLGLTSGSAKGAETPDQRGPQTALLFKPTTFMNRSGEAAQQILERYGYSARRLLVITDDFHLPLGSIRLRESGSDGGHNGLASIIERLDTDTFPRLRVGTGPKPANTEVIEFVLSRFGPSETEFRTQAINNAASACLYLLQTESENTLAQTMSKYNIVRPDPAPGSGAGEASQKRE